GFNTFDFRNGGSDSLKTFFARTGNNFTGRMLIDDIYIDANNQNLSNPGADCNDEAPTNWTTVETFNSLSNGTIDGKSGWDSTGGAKIAGDPADSSNKVMVLDEFETRAYKALPNQISNSSAGTLFFRLRRDGAVDGFGGLADVAAPDAWNDFENQFGSQSQTTSVFTVRDADSFRTSSGGFSDNTWYCVWIVTNNTSDEYTVYVKGGQYSSQTQVIAGGLSNFEFRNGGSDSLRTFYARTGNNFSGRMLIDDIYLLHDSESLSQPVSSCS
ncbi:MAG: hypothetical protein AAF902_13325, partial [Chloroflexota bacterium]